MTDAVAGWHRYLNSGELGRPIESLGIAAPGFGNVHYLDVSAVHDPEKKTATLFVLNRDLTKDRDLEIVWR